MFNSVSNNDSASGSIFLIDDVIFCNKYNKMAILSKNQVELFCCLLRKQGKKEEIMNFIWGGGGSRENETKYNKLIWQTRNKLIRAGFPNDTILTIRNNDIFLNESPTPPKSRMNLGSIDFDIDCKVINSFHM